MRSNYLIWLIVAGLILLGIWYWVAQPGTRPAPTPETGSETLMEESESEPVETITVQLDEQNDLGQTGVVTLTEDPAGQLIVSLNMTGGTFTPPQPAHIHSGACPEPGAVVYALNNVVDGESITTLEDVTWEQLVEVGEPLAINVHKSAAESGVYTACGDLPIKSAADMDDAMDETGETMPADDSMMRY